MAESVLTAYQDVLHDQWDFRDTATAYPDSSDKWGLRPTVNSHYARQVSSGTCACSFFYFGTLPANQPCPGPSKTIFWAIPLALTGQQYDGQRATLALAPDPSIAQQFPVALPVGSAIWHRRPDSGAESYNVRVLSGSVPLDKLKITVTGRRFIARSTGVAGTVQFAVEAAPDE